MKIFVLAFFLLFQFLGFFDFRLETPKSITLADSVRTSKSENKRTANLMFKSADGGQTWQDISAEIVTDEDGSIAPGKTAIKYNAGGQFLQRAEGTGFWEPMYTNIQEKDIRPVLETAGGNIFMVCNKGLFKSDNIGKTWKRVYNQGWVMKLAESNGVLMATSESGILRSTDEGETWKSVIFEGGVGIAIESIKGGFAAITYSTSSETRRVRTSYDGGNSWQAIDAGLPGSLSTASIVEVGENFFCGHPDGIYKSSDKGKTWKLIMPSAGEKVFNLSVSGNVIYAIPKNGGC